MLASSISDRWKIVLQILFVLAVCGAALALLVSMGLMRRPADSHRVEFRVESSGGVAIITLEAGETRIAEPTQVTTPWTKTLQIASGTEVYLTASNPTRTGELTCSIELDNAEWKIESTAAPRDGVACAGIVP